MKGPSLCAQPYPRSQGGVKVLPWPRATKWEVETQTREAPQSLMWRLEAWKAQLLRGWQAGRAQSQRTLRLASLYGATSLPGAGVLAGPSPEGTEPPVETGGPRRKLTTQTSLPAPSMVLKRSYADPVDTPTAPSWASQPPRRHAVKHQTQKDEVSAQGQGAEGRGDSQPCS